jgi:acyl-CoA thioesterase-2
MPDDPTVHAAALVYASDTTVLDSIITTHGLSWGLDRIVAATVNHSIWFHRPFRFDEWVLYATESPVAAGSRGLATGRFFSLEGQLLATVVQEGLIRHFPNRK